MAEAAAQTEQQDRKDGLQALYEAVQCLAAVCDGARKLDMAGFNAVDAPFGHKLARTPVEHWTPRQARAAWAMLRKYRGQLADAGIDYDAIPEPPKAAPGSWRSDRRITVGADGRFVVEFRYDPDLVYAVKQLPGARFDRDRKCWLIPATVAVLEPLVRFATDHGFEYDAAVPQRMEDVMTQAQEQIDASRAADAELEVPGLGGTLRPFQKAGVAYALKAKRCWIADEMGLGKTIQALAAIQAAGAYPALVVCPASLKLNWAREASKWLPGRRVTVLNGKPLVLDGADVVIVNYDILKKWAEALGQVGWQALVVDESHYVKNGKAQRTMYVKDLAKNIPIRLLLTGTPLLNRPIELVSQLQIMGRLGEFGGWWEFVRRYCNAYRDRYGWNLNGASNLEELNRRLRATCYIRREKSQVLTELPEKQRATVPVEIDNRAEYARVEADLIGWLQQKALEDEDFLRSIADLPAEEQEKAKRVRAASAAMRAREAEQLVRIEALKQVAAQGKLGAVREWIETFLESGEKLVVFASHIEIQRALLQAFPGAARVFGEDDAQARQANVDRFQNDPSCRLIVCSLQAAGVGITLTAASNVAFVELGWTPAIHDQAEDRVHRIGQRSQVTAWYLLADGTIDMEIAALIESKRQVVNAATVGESAEVQRGIMHELVQRLLRKEVQE